MRFTKMHGLGNDYLLVNLFAEAVDDPPRLSRLISDRHCGAGSDGLILVCPSSAADVRMEMYNADGSRAQMCGNGIRCVAKFAYEHGLTRQNPMRVETDAGVLTLELSIDGDRVERVRVDMGRPSLEPASLPCTLAGDRVVEQPITLAGRRWEVTCVSMGNPHAVVFVDDLDAVDLAEVGPKFEHAPEFPERVNAHFARVEAADRVAMKTWERGSGATQACGTGACAVCVAGVLTGRTQRRITAHLPGGDLELEWAENDHVFMTGPAVEVFTGDWPTNAGS